MDYNDYKNQMDAHIELKFALQQGNLVYAYSNKIILLLLLQLVAWNLAMQLQ